MPVCQDFKPVCQASTPVYQDSTPVYQGSTPVYQDLMPVDQDFVPDFQDLTSATSDSVSEVYKPFISEALVSLLYDKVNNRKIKILSDKGGSQSLLRADVLSFSEKSNSGGSILLQGVECGIVNVPLHHVFLTPDLVSSGPVTVGVRTSLHIDGVHFLLGNDLAGGKVVPGPVVTDKQKIDEVIDPILEEMPDFYPSCAVTRAMTQKAKLSKPPITNSVSSEYDLADTFLSRIFSDENNGYSDVSMTQSSENICENLDVDKKDLNGQFISDKRKFSFDPFKDYDFNETSHNFQLFSRKNLIAQQRKTLRYTVSSIKPGLRMRFLQSL